MDIAVIGQSGFTLGFRLAGIKHVVDMKSLEDVSRLMNDASTGIVIMDKETMAMLPEHMKESIVRSVKPVVVVVSDEPQEELRTMIIRSIGVDLLQG